jgi:hypothetical protein
MSIEWKYVPVVGLAVTFAKHGRACSRHRIDPSRSNFEKTWEEGDRFFTAMIVTLVTIAVVGIVVYIAVAVFAS